MKEYLLAAHLREDGPNVRIYPGSLVRMIRNAVWTQGVDLTGKPIGWVYDYDRNSSPRTGIVKAFIRRFGAYWPVITWDDTGETKAHFEDVVAL